MREVDRVLRSHIALVTNAANFAAVRHLGQTRKGAAAEPYINHLAEVASLLATSLEEPDAYLVAAGWLHDTIEDTETRPDELEALFGRFVVHIVKEVTDDKSLPKAERKRLQVLNTPHKSEQARMLKLADKTSNLRGIAMSPPANWAVERCAEYISWAEDVANGCRDLNPALEATFDSACAAARRALASRADSGFSAAS